MSNFLITLLAGSILLLLAVAGLAIGRLITGKTMLSRGCGKGINDNECTLCKGQKKKSDCKQSPKE